MLAHAQLCLPPLHATHLDPNCGEGKLAWDEVRPAHNAEPNRMCHLPSYVPLAVLCATLKSCVPLAVFMCLTIFVCLIIIAYVKHVVAFS